MAALTSEMCQTPRMVFIFSLKKILVSSHNGVAEHPPLPNYFS
jgi:hypothetical protein